MDTLYYFLIDFISGDRRLMAESRRAEVRKISFEYTQIGSSIICRSKTNGLKLFKSFPLETDR